MSYSPRFSILPGKKRKVGTPPHPAKGLPPLGTLLRLPPKDAEPSRISEHALLEVKDYWEEIEKGQQRLSMDHRQYRMGKLQEHHP